MSPGPPQRTGLVERAYPRTLIKVSAEIDTFAGRFTATTRDLSLGGVGLELDRPVKEGASLSVGLFLVVDDIEDERSEPLVVRVKVAWCGPTEREGAYSAGVRFEGLLPAQRARLEGFLLALGG